MNTQNEIIYHAVYFCGDELPSAIFTNPIEAKEYRDNVITGKHWMDSEIRIINLGIALDVLDR